MGRGRILYVEGEAAGSRVDAGQRDLHDMIVPGFGEFST